MNLAKHWAATLDDYVIDLAWSPDGSMLAAASAAGGITLFDAATGTANHSLAGHPGGANCLAWMPRGEARNAADLQSSASSPSDFSHLLASGGQDGCVRIWDPVTGREIAETKLGAAWVEHLAWIAQGGPAQDSAEAPASGLPPPASILFAAAGKKLCALRPDGSTAHAFPEAPKAISALAAFHPHNQQPITHNPSTVAAACFGRVAVFDGATFALRKEYSYGNAIYALTWSPDGRWLVAGCHDNAVHLWSPAEDVELHMSGYETRLKELSFSHDGKWLATGGGRDACVWDCSGPGPEGREPLLLPHEARVCAVAFQHAHSFLATGDTRGVFTLWAPTRKNPMFAEVTMPAAATKFAWRADDSLLAVGTEQGQVFVFRTN